MFRCCVLFVFSSLVCIASDWPQWRGPERTGYSQGSPWPESLQGLTPLWRADLDKGYSGPVVSKDMVFTTETRDGDTEVVRGLDRNTGKELWQASWKGKISVPFYAKRSGDWIRATPAWDGKTLFVGGMEEVLVALDGKTGKEIWRIDFPQRYQTSKPEFGFASSPLLDGDFLYVQAAHSTIKLKKSTGEAVWRTLEHASGSFETGAFSSPAIAVIAGKRQLLVQDRIRLNGVDLETGGVLWSQEVPNFRGMNILTPVVYRDGIFTSTHQNNTFLYKVSQQESKYTVTETWRNKAKGYMGSPVVIGGYAYLHLGNQRFTCIDLQTGESKWTTEPFGQYWSMAVRGDKIIALDERGQLLLIRPNPEKFELLDSKEVSQTPTWGHVAVAGDQIFVRELKGIAAYRLAAGEASGQ
jgi:outer membrane protein assembly factor BamB